MLFFSPELTFTQYPLEVGEEDEKDCSDSHLSCDTFRDGTTASE